MKIGLTGGGSGGHFYPLIAVVEEIHEIVRERSLVAPELHYFSDGPYDRELLYENDIEYHYITAGKFRTYFSPKNIVDWLRSIVGVPQAIGALFSVYPDVIFSKGSYVSVPVLTAARLLRIPVIIHDSDVVPGRANLWAAKFAERIAISYPEAEQYFERKDVLACTGNPVRRPLRVAASEGAHEFLELSKEVPTILVLGGSQGAQAVNDALTQALGELLNDYQIVHSTGEANYKALKVITDVQLENHPYKARYKPFATMNAVTLRMAAGAASVIVSRAGSGAIFEVAQWEKPAILVPIPDDVSRDQRLNAFAYARAGGATVIEQENLKPHVLAAEIRRLIDDREARAHMIESARAWKKPDAARLIAEEIIAIGLRHES